MVKTKFNSEDCIKLGEILEKYDNTTLDYEWIRYINEWIIKYDIESIIETIIDCFIHSYRPLGIEDYEINRVVYEIPLAELAFLSSEISIEDSQGILANFAEWRLSINK